MRLKQVTTVEDKKHCELCWRDLPKNRKKDICIYCEKSKIYERITRDKTT